MEKTNDNEDVFRAKTCRFGNTKIKLNKTLSFYTMLIHCSPSSTKTVNQELHFFKQLY